MHIIRLRGPWELEVISRFAQHGDVQVNSSGEVLPSIRRVTMPAGWTEVLGDGFFGRVRCVRKFNKPSGLHEDERVFLVVQQPQWAAKLVLGTRPIGRVEAGGSERIDITDGLDSHNRLEITVERPAATDVKNPRSADSPAGSIVGEVRLEIED